MTPFDRHRPVSPTRRALLAAAPALALAACGRRPSQAEPVPPDPLPPLKSVASFPVGVSLGTSALGDPAFVDLVTTQFDQATAEWEMKMERILGPHGELDFAAPDAIADFCRDNRFALHGHTLVWYAQRPPSFERLVGDRPAFEKALRDYIAAVVGRYRGLARGWDALNEPVSDKGVFRDCVWNQALGPDYARLAFEFAREADPQAVLFINDYNLEVYPAKLDAFQRLLEQLLKAGAPVNGIGTQTHIWVDLPPGQASAAIKALARFGLPIHVSELDISTRPRGLSFSASADPLAAQARIAAEVAEAFMDLPASQRYAFTIWGGRDKDSWLRRPPNAGDGSDRPLLFDDDGRPKPAFAAVRRAFEGRGFSAA